jgi:integrase
MSDFIHARDTLAEFGETIQDAVKHRADYLTRVRRHGITVQKLSDEVVAMKRKDGLSTDYTNDLELRLRRFCQGFGQRAIASITVEELDSWLRNLEGSPGSRANYRRNVGVLFSYALSRRIIDQNPITFTAKPKIVDAEPEIFTVDELDALLNAAQRIQPSVVSTLAIGAFAGLRDAEIERLDWSEVDLTRGHIEVKAAKVKTAKRRIVPIQPNLSAWLTPYAGMADAVVPAGARRKLAAVRKAAKLASWPNNGLRHSFASYRLAAINDAPRVAAELGHTNPNLLYSTYRALVLPTEAERYWKIEPPVAESGNVVALRAG